jgi:hypothetical protein
MVEIKNPQTGEMMQVWGGITWVSTARAEWSCPGCEKQMGLDFEEGKFEEAVDGLWVFCDDCRPEAESKVASLLDYSGKLHDAVRKYRLDRFMGYPKED